MKVFNALIKKNDEEKIVEILMVKEGFSWTALFFSAAWFLYHKMWQEFLVVLLVFFSFEILAKFLAPADKFLIEIMFNFLVALNANYWRCQHLKRKKFQLVGMYFGDSSDQAKVNFIKDSEVSDFEPRVFCIN